MQNETYFVHGVLSQDMGWQAPRLFEDADCPKNFAALKASQNDYVISIEHEDRGFYLSRDVLKPFIH